MREWMSGLEGVVEVPSLQANVIAEALTAALDNLPALQEGALRSRERLRLRYDIGVCADEHINIYRRAC
jgi:glycosyltransferase involved in cell wall biosynthesis